MTAAWLWLASLATAGVGPAHTVVLYNADSPEATEVAGAYAAARDLAPGHQCGVTGLDPATRRISFEDFDRLIRQPLEACLAALPDPDRIDVIVTVRGLPYLVDPIAGSGPVGLEPLLQVGRARTPDDRELAGLANGQAASVPNPAYVAWEDGCAPADLAVPGAGQAYQAACALTRAKRLPPAFARASEHVLEDWDFTGELYIVSRLDGFDFADALALVDRGVAADGAFPTAPITCMKAADPARGVRDAECEYMVRRLQEIGAAAEWIDTFDPELTGREVASLFTGAALFRDGIAGQTYAPGAVACNLTSVGAAPTNFFCAEDGTCPAGEAQTSIARFVRAGATAQP